MNCRAEFEKVNSEIEGRICDSKHIHKLLEIKSMGKCEVYLETGTLFGGSMALQMRDPQPCHYIGIDLFNGYYADFSYGSTLDPVCRLEVTEERAERNIRKQNIHNHPFDLIKGSSYAPETVTRVKELLNGRTIDFLFIDGDHSFNGVMSDWNAYKDLVSVNGLICFDNYSTTSWLEVKKAIDTIDFTGYKVYPVVDECFIVRKRIKQNIKK